MLQLNPFALQQQQEDSIGDADGDVVMPLLIHHRQQQDRHRMVEGTGGADFSPIGGIATATSGAAFSPIGGTHVSIPVETLQALLADQSEHRRQQQLFFRGPPSAAGKSGGNLGGGGGVFLPVRTNRSSFEQLAIREGARTTAGTGGQLSPCDRKPRYPNWAPHADLS